ncbi:mCG145902, partial [Mus musculus]
VLAEDLGSLPNTYREVQSLPIQSRLMPVAPGTHVVRMHAYRQNAHTSKRKFEKFLFFSNFIQSILILFIPTPPLTPLRSSLSSPLLKFLSLFLSLSLFLFLSFFLF